jgi:Rrf2 family protein
MPLLSRKDILAIAAVIDVALHAKERPVSAKILAARQKLPPRHLEPVLQVLVRQGILKSIRGPHGGYVLGRDGDKISTDDILRAAAKIEDENEPKPASPLIDEVVRPALAEAQQLFSQALSRIKLSDLSRSARSQ